jgi:hypothetical protein
MAWCDDRLHFHSPIDDGSALLAERGVRYGITCDEV